jgi:hypothetical protein
MSTKTLRKRIALVAISALGAGVLSVAPANAATHAAAGSANLVAAADTLNVATKASVTGSAVTSTTTEDGSANYNRSVGLLYKDTSTGTAQSATMLSTGTLALYTVAATATWVASGGAFSSLVSTTSTNNAVSGDLKKALSGGTGVAGIHAIAWKPSAVGSYTISFYTGATTYADPTTGTLSGVLTVTVAATSAGSVYSAADSLCNLGVTSTSAAATDVTGASLRKNGDSAFIAIALEDAYGVALDAGATVATATNGAYVNIVASGTTTKGTGSTAVSASAPTNLNVVVSQPTANKPVSTTVTITYNGTTVCTKAITIAGETASIVLSSVGTQDIAATFVGPKFKVRNLDSAGNLVTPTATAQFAAVAASLSTTVVTTASVTGVATSVSSSAAESYSSGNFECGGVAGTTNVVLAFQNPSGSVVTSAPTAMRCAGDPYTYKASWDKASYVQGEIATLTVSFLDSKGNAANQTTTGNTATVTAPMMTYVGTIAPDATAEATGVIKHTFTVGTASGLTEGSYVALVNYPTLVDDVKQSIITAPYKVGTGTTGVSNADVLKAIVSLIASINKQIAALQKALLKR